MSIDAKSSVCGCELLSGSVKGSALCGVTAGVVTAEGAILVNVTAKSVRAGPGAIVYNVVDDSEEGLTLAPGEVLTTVFAEDGSQTLMRCTLQTDGKEAWSKVLEGNPSSFEEVHKRNKGVDPHKCEQMQFQAHDSVAEKLGAKRKRGS